MFSSKFYRIPSSLLPCNARHAQTKEHAERAEAAAAKQVESARAVAELKVESARALEAAKVELAGEIGGQKVKLARAEEALRVRCAEWVGSRRGGSQGREAEGCGLYALYKEVEHLIHVLNCHFGQAFTFYQAPSIFMRMLEIGSASPLLSDVIE